MSTPEDLVSRYEAFLDERGKAWSKAAAEKSLPGNQYLVLPVEDWAMFIHNKCVKGEEDLLTDACENKSAEFCYKVVLLFEKGRP